jgi:hypothetical protein
MLFAARQWQGEPVQRSRRRTIRHRFAIPVLLLSLTGIVGCSENTVPQADSTTMAETAASPSATTELVGSWHRAQTCKELLAAFEKAGLAESHRDWLQGNFYGGDPGPTDGDVCKGARGPLEHDHFFTVAGAFGSHDENGEEVDSGDYAVVDENTVSFPSHAAEFGYDGDLVVGYAVSGDVATFDVDLPESCSDKCADAYAWALSAFASGPWERGEVP